MFGIIAIRVGHHSQDGPSCRQGKDIVSNAFGLMPVSKTVDQFMNGLSVSKLTFSSKSVTNLIWPIISHSLTFKNVSSLCLYFGSMMVGAAVVLLGKKKQSFSFGPQASISIHFKHHLAVRLSAWKPKTQQSSSNSNQSIINNSGR